jgi:hypothetical protein
MHISFLLAETGKANVESSKITYAVTDGFASFQTRKNMPITSDVLSNFSME